MTFTFDLPEYIIDNWILLVSFLYIYLSYNLSYLIIRYKINYYKKLVIKDQQLLKDSKLTSVEKEKIGNNISWNIWYLGLWNDSGGDMNKTISPTNFVVIFSPVALPGFIIFRLTICIHQIMIFPASLLK